MSNWTAPTNWYWSVQDSSPGTQVWQSSSASFVVLANADYVAFLAAGNIATVIDTFADLEVTIGNFNSLNWAYIPQSNSLTFSADTTLTVAQLAKLLVITNTNGAIIHITLPTVLLPGSVPLGNSVRIINISVGLANSISLKSASGTAIGGIIQAAGGIQDIEPYAFDDTKWQVFGYTAFSPGSLGTPGTGRLLIGQGADAGGALTAQFEVITGDISITNAGVTALQNIPNDTPMAGDLLATEIAAPSAPAASHLRIYGDSTSNNLAAINHAGTVNHGAQSFLASASHWLIQLRDDGSWATSQPASTDLSDFTDWGSWVPTWTGSGNGAAVTMTGVSAQFMRIHNIVFFVLSATISSIGTATGTLVATLPTTPNAAGMAPGYEAALTGKQLQARISSGANTTQIQFYDNSNMLTNGDVPVITGFYKSA